MNELYNENLFSERFRIKSARLSKWDYSSPGYYFVTICTINKTNYFGNIENGKMILSDIGWVAEKYWQEIPNHFLQIKLDEFIIMPNHVHGIIRIINKYNIDSVETCHGMSLQNKKIHKQYNKFSQPISGSIPMIINHYKGTCTRAIRQLPNPFIFHWQSRYHDRVIRNEIELNIIQKYIKNNPKNWQFDRNNKLLSKPLK